MKMFEFNMPVRCFAGKDVIEKHQEEIAVFGRKCLVVTGASSAKKSGAQDAVEKAFRELKIEWTVYDGIGENPLLTSCREAGQKGYDFGAEFVLGIGGGSPMDAAKAAAVFGANPGLSEADFYAKNWEKEPLPIVLLGTTAGTGSEVTDVSVLTDSAGRKHSIHDPKLYARLAFGDPSFTLSVPRSVTLSTGLDVIAHAVESYMSKKANRLSRGYSVTAVRTAFEPLLKAACEFDRLSYEDREALYEASLFAGLAIAVTGTVFPHNMGYYLTEEYKVPHGFACAAYMKALLKYVKSADRKLYERFFEETGLSFRGLEDLLEQALPDFKKEYGIWAGDREIESILPRWENNNSVKNTVGEVTLEDVRRFMEESFE